MKYQVSKIYIPIQDIAREMEILNEHAAQGWEPYAVKDNFHYFKRAEQMPVPVGQGISENSEIAGKGDGVEVNKDGTPTIRHKRNK